MTTVRRAIWRGVGARLTAVVCGLTLVLVACDSSKPPQTPTTPAAPEKPQQTAAAEKTEPKAETAAPVALPPVEPGGAKTGTFLDRDNPDVIRVMTYNIEWNSIFPDVNAAQATKFARVVHALNPDILSLQEIGSSPRDRDKVGVKKRSAEDVLKVMNTAAPLPGGGQWYAYQGGDGVIVSKYPLKMTVEQTDPPGDKELAMALVDLPDKQCPVDFYVVDAHFKCCQGATEQSRRQKQADAIVSWVRDARSPGGKIDLPPGTAIAVMGDFNIVAEPAPAETVVTGEISDETTYGQKSSPDWDDTPFTDAHPLHNVAGPDDWTWRNDNQQYKPGRLDYIIYSDSVLEVAKKFILNTTTMTEADLKAAGLQKFDIAKDDEGKEFDHVPLVVDFRVNASAMEKGDGAVE